MSIRFLGLEEILALHAEQIERYGGAAGVRDLGLLESAAAMPEASFGDAYLHGTPPEMASAYLYHLSQNHAFVDGNKRTALVVARTFLLLNNSDVEASQEEKYLTFLRLAEGSLTEEELTAWIRGRLKSN